MSVPLIGRVPGILPRSDVRPSQPHQVSALVGIAAHLGTGPAAHPLLELPYRRLPRPAERREIDGTMHVAAGAFYFEESEAGVQRVADWRGGLTGPTCFHAIVPRVASCDVGDETGALIRILGRRAPLPFF